MTDRATLGIVNWWTLILAAGATARITRLITADTITGFVRRWFALADAKRKLSKVLRDINGAPVIRADGTSSASASPGDVPRLTVESPGALYTFITCPWCVSMWVGFAAVAAIVFSHDQTHRALLYAFAALTASAVTGELAARRSA